MEDVGLKSCQNNNEGFALFESKKYRPHLNYDKHDTASGEFLNYNAHFVPVHYPVGSTNIDREKSQGLIGPRDGCSQARLRILTGQS